MMICLHDTLFIWWFVYKIICFYDDLFILRENGCWLTRMELYGNDYGFVFQGHLLLTPIKKISLTYILLVHAITNDVITYPRPIC